MSHFIRSAARKMQRLLYCAVTETREKQWIVTLEELEKQNASLFCSEEILIGSERTLTDFVLVPKQTKLTKLFVFMDE